MPNLTLRGAYIRFIDVRWDEKSKTLYTKVNFTASYSKPVRDAMEWGELATGYTQADLEGELNATKFVLTPHQPELKEHEVQLSAQSVGSFGVYRVSGENDSKKNELRFQLITTAKDAPTWLSNYQANIGKGEGLLKITHQEQGDLLEGQAQEPVERLISEEQARETTLTN